MTTEEKITVMQAYLDNKTIEIKSKTEKEWNTCDFEPLWDWLKYEYRIKSEYIPFDFSDAQNLIGKTIIENEKTVYLITKVSSKGVLIADEFVHFDYLLKCYKFLNGTPCGKLKQ